MIELDPELRTALARWRSAALQAAAQPEAVAAARQAMRDAIDSLPRGWRAAALQRMRSAVRQPLAAGTAATIVVASGVAAAGWHAPAGSPFHVLRLVDEGAQLTVPGQNRGALELGFAKERLEEVHHGNQAALPEALGLLSDAQANLPADPASPLRRQFVEEQAEADSQSRESSSERSAPDSQEHAGGQVAGSSQVASSSQGAGSSQHARSVAISSGGGPAPSDPARHKTDHDHDKSSSDPSDDESQSSDGDRD